ncbi:MAG: deoxyribonuclease V [Actinobacteria bacterium]|jgi:deoxyribonuclease V|nr:MAG: deoxyribonuclease V [Actinomycetota bacterium]
MRIPERHPLDVSVAEARAIQERLRGEVREERVLDPAEIGLIAGTDISYLREHKLALGAAVLMDYPTLEVLQVCTSAVEVAFPYVPGLLSFRELPALLPALEALDGAPDLLLVDGQGLAHPRAFGLASHLGVLTGIPTVGCAKSRLVGEAGEPGPEVGDWTPLLYEGRIVGAVLRTRRGVKPLYVSVGHLIDLATCVRMILGCLRGVRLPEPQRRAHLAADELKRAVKLKLSSFEF